MSKFLNIGIRLVASLFVGAAGWFLIYLVQNRPLLWWMDVTRPYPDWVYFHISSFLEMFVIMAPLVTVILVARLLFGGELSRTVIRNWLGSIAISTVASYLIYLASGFLFELLTSGDPHADLGAMFGAIVTILIVPVSFVIILGTLVNTDKGSDIVTT